ncbi:MAG: YdcF family protein [Clostridia bacterium]|nr:YdcF family protein [Clostridia bacterium]
METAKLKKGYSPVGRALLILAGVAGIWDTAFVLTRSSVNLGVLMPAVLGAPLLVIGLFLPLFKKLCAKSRVFRALAFLVSLAYALFGLLFAVTTGLILANSTEPEDGADAVIVLGSGIRGNTPTLTLRYRLDAALDYLERNPGCTAVVSGGQGPGESVSEASVMRSWLISRGIPEERIIVEDRSLSTEENFMFSSGLIRDDIGPDAKIVFATTRFHVFRSERTARSLGIEAEGIPAKGVWYITPNDYLRECAAIVSYFLTGRI